MTYENSIGDNSGQDLESFVKRAANLMLQQKDLGEDLKEVCAEADAAGVATKSQVRRRARESLMDPEVLRDRLATDAEQRAALGWFNSLPKGSEPTFDDRGESAKPTRRGRPRKNNGVEAPF